MLFTPNDFEVGQRILMHPATDLWMRGARYGTVTAIGRKKVGVKLDALKSVIRVDPDYLLPSLPLAY